MVRRYFAREQAAIEKLEAGRDDLTRQMEEMDEEHGGEEGLLADGKTDKGKLSKVSVTARLKEIGRDRSPSGPPDENADERKALEEYLSLIEKESAAGKKVKDAQKALAAEVAQKYGELTVDEIKTLVVDDKWLATLAEAVQSELNRVSQALTSRIQLLAERYATPLPKLADEVAALESKVSRHLERMGFRP